MDAKEKLNGWSLPKNRLVTVLFVFYP